MEWLPPNVLDAISVDDLNRKNDELKQFRIGCKLMLFKVVYL
jgi:hypothetical protein